MRRRYVRGLCAATFTLSGACTPFGSADSVPVDGGGGVAADAAGPDGQPVIGDTGAGDGAIDVSLSDSGSSATCSDGDPSICLCPAGTPCAVACPSGRGQGCMVYCPSGFICDVTCAAHTPTEGIDCKAGTCTSQGCQCTSNGGMCL
jgi:hypothetical protein